LVQRKHAFLSGVNGNLPEFFTFSFELDKIWYRCVQKGLFNDFEFRENALNESRTFLNGHNLISVPTFHIYSLIWVESHIRDNADNAVGHV
jgi:hypothetical protein